MQLTASKCTRKDTNRNTQTHSHKQKKDEKATEHDGQCAEKSKFIIVMPVLITQALIMTKTLMHDKPAVEDHRE